MNNTIVVFTKEIHLKSLIQNLDLCGLINQIAYIVHPDNESALMGNNDHNKQISFDIQVIKYSDFKNKVTKLNLNFNLGISFMFPHIFSRQITELFDKGIINFHPSLLPLNRGANPVAWAIYNGSSHGVTAHLVDAKIDNGPILAQTKIDVRFYHTAEKLYFESISELEKLVVDVIPAWLNNKITPTPPFGVSSFHLIKDLESLKYKDISEIIDAFELLNLLRAASFSEKDGLRLKIDNEVFDLYLRIEKLNEN